MESLDLVVVQVRDETSRIRSVRFAHAEGGRLPSWCAGAHIEVALPNGDSRSYSLIDWSGAAGKTETPMEYIIGVRLEQESKGGSAFIHSLQVGDRIRASHPRNHFQLTPNTGDVLLVAGGIGITPIVSMAAELVRLGRSFRLVYAARSRSELTFMAELERLCGDRLFVHCDDEAGSFCDLGRIMSQLNSSTSMYICGPTVMIDLAIAKANAFGWQKDRLRFELFSSQAASSSDQAFDVVLAQSGKLVTVGAGQTILEALQSTGVDPIFSCRRGDCGICQVTVIEGVPDHRDYSLSDAERSSNKVIQICVSRAHTPVLVLDL